MRIAVPTTHYETRMLLDWAAKRIGQDTFERAQAVAFMHNHELVGVMVLHDHAHPNVLLSWAFTSPKYFTRLAIRTAYHWAFDQLGVERITGLVDKKNKAARKLNERLGMKLEGVLRKASPEGRDIFVYGMLREEGEALLERINGKAKNPPSA